MQKESIPERKETPDNHKWDLTHLFRSDQDWEAYFKETENKIDKYNSFKGRLNENENIFLEAVEFDLSISRRVEKLFTYAHLKSDEDKSNQLYLGFYERSINLYTRISELSSFLAPEIQSIPEKNIANFLKNKKIKEYSFYIEKILRFKPHTLTLETERILAMSEEVAHAPSQVFSQLDNADLKFGKIIDENGNEVELSHGNFNSFLIKKSREIRKKAFFQYYKSYKDHKYTLATALNYTNKKDIFYSGARKFKNSRHSSLFTDNIPDELYDNLIVTVKKNLSPLFKYFKFRKEALGLNDLHFYDTYLPLISEVDFNMPYEKAVDTCVNALNRFGNEYTNTLKKGLLHGWVDRYENKGKRSGAYSSGCYDSPPYILLNYTEDNINSLYTLIHEAGHSMHSYYSKNAQPYVYYDYTIFIAEIASTLNETLLSNYLISKYENNKKMKAYIINREIDNIRTTLFRQTMFAEFEKISHAILEQNKPLTLDIIMKVYRELLETYFGSTMVIDEELTLECLRIPHFYSAFYVYKYATGISASITLAEKIIKEGDSARDSYLNFLRLGGSKFPLDELLDAGIDMKKPQPIENAIKYFDELVDRFIEIYKDL